MLVTKFFSRDPLKALFFAHIEQQDSDTLQSKIKIIQQFTRELEELECNSENQSNFLHWASIFSGFSGCLALTGATLLNPILGLLVATSAASSAAVVISGSYLRNHKVSEVVQKLKRYRLALNSSTPKNWAILWHLSGLELFLESLWDASKGNINHKGQLVRNDGKNALAVASDYSAERMGISRNELLAQSQKIISFDQTSIHSQPTLLQASNTSESAIPTALNPTLSSAPNHHQTALNILDALVLTADNKTLGGCVIIASPGAGKTTFLGTAWGRLRIKYGDKFQSLAVVVKQSDIAFFKRFATHAIAVKDSPVAAALAIIKFIDCGMKGGKISRVFLDDFLTMNLLFENALKNVWIDPSSYAISDKKELGLVSLAGHLQATLNEAWLVGREYNLCLWVSSHSPNLDALPFCGSRDSRSVGDIIFLAKNNKREFIELALSNAHLISNAAKRSELKILLDELDSGTEPLVLANNNNWMLGVVPNSIYAEYQTYRERCLEVVDTTQNSINVEQKTSIQQDHTRQQLERFLALPSAERINTLNLSIIASTILEIVKSGNPPVKFDAIRKSRKWGEEAPVTSTVKAGISELITLKLIDGDNENGYITTA
ncbi:hypothetical protein [Nostoc sp. FACHB-133]|uniref:hypothetical protein n=1 Tax=Nostoc sp. FACHB-133 TaxID=2692835 RepID=UPI0016824C2B|nr:hypothetical protein [Nostoc sp. FACHB-133]MBD2527370.1 hypothetical protein [Nostoc sp. FACHB-133]